MNARQRKRDEEGNGWKIDISLLGSKKKSNIEAFVPSLTERKNNETKKKKKRRYSGDKDRSLTPHCFPFSILLGHVAGSTFEFPAFFPICERVIRVKLRSLVQESLLRDKISLQNESNKKVGKRDIRWWNYCEGKRKKTRFLRGKIAIIYYAIINFRHRRRCCLILPSKFSFSSFFSRLLSSSVKGMMNEGTLCCCMLM